MIVKVENILILVLFFVISFSVTKQLDFCQTFVDNNNTINYGYQHWSDGYYFFIDSNYWRLEHNSNGFKLLNRSALLVPFMITGSYMDGSFEFVFSAKLCENNHTECHNYSTSGTGRYLKWPVNDLLRLFWLHLKFNSSSGDLEVDTSVRDKDLVGMTTTFKLDIQPMIAFQLISGPDLCFLQKTSDESENGMNFYMAYRCGLFYKYSGYYGDLKVYGFENRTDYVIANLKKVMDNQNITYDSDYTILNDINDTNDCIAIFNVGDRYVFFYKHEKRIFYCFSTGALFNKGCLSSPLQTLIDCSITTKGMTTTIVSTEEPKVSDNVTNISTTEPPIETQFNDQNKSTDEPIVNKITTEGGEAGPPFATDDSNPKGSNSSFFWILLIVIVLIVIIIIVMFIVFRFILWKQKDDNNNQLKNDSQSTDEGNSSALKEPVAPNPSQTGMKKESNEGLTDTMKSQT